MGWNDRLPEDPYIPPESFYRDRDDYEAWLEYVDAQLDAEENAGFTSQNIDPQTVLHPQEAPARQSFMSRIVAKLFGRKNDKASSQSKKARKRVRKEKLDFPF
jgi:hypothetical protein